MAGDPAAIARCSRLLGPDVDAREWLGDYRRFGAACGCWLLQVTSLLQTRLGACSVSGKFRANSMKVIFSLGANSGPNVHRSTRTETTFDGAVRMKRAELGRREPQPRPRGPSPHVRLPLSMDDFARRGFRLDRRAERETREGHARSFLTGVNLAVANWLDPHSALAEILLARPDRRGCRLGHRQVGQRGGPHDHGVDGRVAGVVARIVADPAAGVRHGDVAGGGSAGRWRRGVAAAA
jgi:hypothetical protein